MDTIKIGDFLKSLRKANGLTQQDVADELLVSPKSVSRWESGDGLPDIGIISSVAELYEVSVDEILKGERNTKQTDLKAATVTQKNKVKDNVVLNSVFRKFSTFLISSIASKFILFIVGLALLFTVNDTIGSAICIISFIVGFVIFRIGTIDLNNSIEDCGDIIDGLREKINKRAATFRFTYLNVNVGLVFIFLMSCVAKYIQNGMTAVNLSLLAFSIVICYLNYWMKKQTKLDKQLTNKIAVCLLASLIFFFGYHGHAFAIYPVSDAELSIGYDYLSFIELVRGQVTNGLNNKTLMYVGYVIMAISIITITFSFIKKNNIVFCLGILLLVTSPLLVISNFFINDYVVGWSVAVDVVIQVMGVVDILLLITYIVLLFIKKKKNTTDLNLK